MIVFSWLCAVEVACYILMAPSSWYDAELNFLEFFFYAHRIILGIFSRFLFSQHHNDFISRFHFMNSMRRLVETVWPNSLLRFLLISLRSVCTLCSACYSFSLNFFFSIVTQKCDYALNLHFSLHLNHLRTSNESIVQSGLVSNFVYYSMHELIYNCNVQSVWLFVAVVPNRCTKCSSFHIRFNYLVSIKIFNHL